MFEFVPFAVAAVLGALICRSCMKPRFPLMAAAALAVGFIATVGSGEYLAGWITLPNDIALAALGVLSGGVAARVIRTFRFRI